MGKEVEKEEEEEEEDSATCPAKAASPWRRMDMAFLPSVSPR